MFFSCPFCLLYVFNKFRARLAVNFFLLIICQVSAFCCCLLLLSFSLNLSWARSVNRIVDFIMQPPNQIAIKRTWTKNLNKPDEKAKTKVKHTKNLSAKQTQIKQNKKNKRINPKSKAKCAHEANATKCNTVDAWQPCRHSTTLADSAPIIIKSKAPKRSINQSNQNLISKWSKLYRISFSTQTLVFNLPKTVNYM